MSLKFPRDLHSRQTKLKTESLENTVDIVLLNVVESTEFNVFVCPVIRLNRQFTSGRSHKQLTNIACEHNVHVKLLPPNSEPEHSLSTQLCISLETELFEAIVEFKFGLLKNVLLNNHDMNRK